MHASVGLPQEANIRSRSRASEASSHRVNDIQALIASPVRKKAKALVAPPQPLDCRKGQEYHPRLADDLSEQEFEAAEGEPEKDDRVRNEADQARGQHRKH